MAQQTNTSLVDEVLDDAVQVRETALANAKLALEEAFEPRIKSMISNHLSEMDDEDMDEERDEDMDEERDEDMDEERDEDMDEERDEDMDEELTSSNIGSSDNAEPSDDASNTSKIGEGEDHDDMEERGMVNAEDETEEDDLDLESVIAELEAELDDEEGEEDIDMDEMDMDSDEEEMDMDEEDDEIIDLEELLSALSEDEDEEMEEADEDEEMDELAQENAKLTSELAEHREAVEILRSKLNEVNLLNAKLLYTTKLFRKYNLNNSQKMKVVESFDRTNSVRETKLIYSTLAESLGIGSQKSNNKRASITEGFASKPTTSTKPKQEIISESNEMAERFKRLISYNK